MNLNKYHAHIYYDMHEKQLAKSIQGTIKEKFDVFVGEMKDREVGPHTKSMFRVIFYQENWVDLIPWLMLKRQNLSVLIHPLTGNSYDDHIKYAIWMGKKLKIKSKELDYNIKYPKVLKNDKSV